MLLHLKIWQGQHANANRSKTACKENVYFGFTNSGGMSTTWVRSDVCVAFLKTPVAQKKQHLISEQLLCAHISYHLPVNMHSANFFCIFCCRFTKDWQAATPAKLHHIMRFSNQIAFEIAWYHMGPTLYGVSQAPSYHEGFH